MKAMRLAATLIFAMLVIACLTFSVSAEGEALAIKTTPNLARLTDGNETTRGSVTELTVTSETPVESLYLIYYDTPTAFTLVDESGEINIPQTYLRSFIDVKALLGDGKTSLTLRFEQQVSLLEVYAFGAQVPDWVQIWEDPCEKADLCLMTSHADDEQLFFAGILPYYAGEKGYEVQVIYFTDHKNEPLRRHELLRGLWTVGVTHYPVISPFPDLYSESEATAERQFANAGYSREAVVGFQVEQLRRFKPLVVIGHDPDGEYGHGQHRLNSATLQEAVQIAGNPESYPESAVAYGVWEVPKTYLHLYEENPIVMDWDVPLEAFGGKTAFNVTQEGFLCHDSQQYTWFRRWLNGNNGEITKASQITEHSPCNYGLYLSRVGEDVTKNDFFENVKTWEQQRIEEEERIRAEEEAQRLAEEEAARKAEEERKAKEEEERRLAEEEARRKAAAKEAADRSGIQKKIALIVLLVVVSAVAVVIYLYFMRK